MLVVCKKRDVIADLSFMPCKKDVTKYCTYIGVGVILMQNSDNSKMKN